MSAADLTPITTQALIHRGNHTASILFTDNVRGLDLREYEPTDASGDDRENLHRRIRSESGRGEYDAGAVADEMAAEREFARWSEADDVDPERVELARRARRLCDRKGITFAEAVVQLGEGRS